MATVRLKFKPSFKEGKEGTIYYQLIHDKVVRPVDSGYKIFNYEWNLQRACIAIPTSMSRRRMALLAIRDHVRYDVKRLKEIVKGLEGVEYSADDILSIFNKTYRSVTLFSFLQDMSRRLREQGSQRTSETYLSVLYSFTSYRRGEDMPLKDLDSDMVEGYEAFLKQRNVALNTISFYMRTLRSTYNRAVEKGLVPEKNIFKRAFTAIERTQKRAIPLAHISKIKELELSHAPNLAFARDMFLFSFYTRGMSFIDMAYLRKKDIKEGEIIYRRKKTGQNLRIKWEKCMTELTKRYPNDTTEYLLPIITIAGDDIRQQYLRTMTVVNKNLKRVAKLAGLATNLTMYVARHSWASAARSKNIPISVISEGMGHDSETTTQIYLASLDTTVVDKANRLILKSI